MVRSSLKSASRQKRGPDAAKTPRWSAAGRSVLRQRTRTPLQGVNEMWRHVGAPFPRILSGAGKGKAACPGPQTIRAIHRAIIPSADLPGLRHS